MNPSHIPFWRAVIDEFNATTLNFPDCVCFNLSKYSVTFAEAWKAEYVSGSLHDHIIEMAYEFLSLHGGYRMTVIDPTDIDLETDTVIGLDLASHFLFQYNPNAPGFPNIYPAFLRWIEEQLDVQPSVPSVLLKWNLPTELPRAGITIILLIQSCPTRHMPVTCPGFYSDVEKIYYAFVASKDRPSPVIIKGWAHYPGYPESVSQSPTT